jgi:hypothetical protein
MIKNNSVKVLALVDNRELQLAVLYSSLIFFIPAFVHQQLLTGPIINALLVLSFLHLGKSKSFFLALIPSTVALSRGLLPLTLAPMVPFIMISNCLYLEIFARLKTNDQTINQAKNFLAIFVASLVKAAFLFVISKLLMEKILVAALASKIAVMMSWPQFATALLGGILALLVDASLKKKYATR